MTAATEGSGRFKIEPNFGIVVCILAAVALVRLAGLMISDVDLFIDESQYWSWSNELAWGYFSKPPLLPWIIHLAEALCGSGEACIRAPSPVLYFGVGVVVYLTAASLYGPVTGFWAALLMTFGTGLVFSSRIISTDVPLLFFWAMALLAYVKLLNGPDWRWAFLLGVSLGLGLLAKYAMIYFVPGMLLAALLDVRSRALLRTRSIWFAFAIAAVIVAPNIGWVFSHEMATFKSVAANVETDEGVRFNPGRAVEFLAAQFGVFGPVIFFVLLYEISKIRSPEEVPAGRLMLAFAIPPLAIITSVAIISKPYANWAATAVVSSTILAAAFLVKRNAWGWLVFCLLLGVAEQGALLYGDANAYHLAVPFLPAGKSEIYSRTLGFKALGDQVGSFVDQIGAKTVVGEDRGTVAALLYYRRNEPQQVLAWPSPDVRQFDMTRGLGASASEPIILVTQCPFPKRLAKYYSGVELLGTVHSPTGPTGLRHHTVFRLGGAKEALSALPDCARE